MRLQFRLRTLLIGMVFVSAVLAWFVCGEIFYIRKMVRIVRTKETLTRPMAGF
jgi:uncharacterized membrane protein YciS (DUF1049 family)